MNSDIKKSTLALTKCTPIRSRFDSRNRLCTQLRKDLLKLQTISGKVLLQHPEAYPLILYLPHC